MTFNSPDKIREWPGWRTGLLFLSRVLSPACAHADEQCQTKRGPAEARAVLEASCSGSYAWRLYLDNYFTEHGGDLTL